MLSIISFTVICRGTTKWNMGKAVKKPAKDTILSFAATQNGTGKSFAIQEFMDQIGAFLGPVLLFFVLAVKQGGDMFSKYSFCFAILGIPAFMGMMDLYRYVFSADASEDAGYFLRIGILMYVVILFANSFNQIMKRMRIASEAEIMRQVAYTDALTRLPNRTAFLDKEKELQDKVRSGAVSRVLVCQFDVNNLKIVNDTYGHAYGDRHLIAAAEAIREAFGESGQCYRVGGDEFTLFMTKEPLMENFESCIEKMKQNQEEYSKKPDTKLTLELAYGQAFYDGKEIDSIEKAEQIADSNMYGKKTEMKNINEE